MDLPGYAALILRRTYADLSKPGALMDRSKEYLAGTGATWNERDKRWTFPSGASITFGYLQDENDKYQYASAEFQYIAFDELTHFTETQYTFLFTRLRKKHTGALAGVPLRMRSASNPGGPGHDWVKRRFVDPRTRQRDRVFIPARLEDNPSLDRDEYLISLANTDPMTREQIQRGDWDAVAGGKFRRDWFRYYGRSPHDDTIFVVDGKGIHREQLRLVFLTADTAASVKTSADYTVISAWGITRDYKLLWLDCHRGRWEVPDILPEIERKYREHDAAFVGIETVGAHSGTGIYQQARRTKLVVRAFQRKAGEDKLQRATPAIILAESGRLHLPAARPAWVEDVEAELVRFTGDEKVDSNDDIVDTLSDAVRVLAGQEDAGASAFRPYTVGG